MHRRFGIWLFASALCVLVGTTEARPRHRVASRRIAPASGAPRDHQRFAGGGTGGDSPKPAGSGPELLFTFDDGPALGKTEKVLDLLDEHGIKAVFFVCGAHFEGKSAAAEKARALLRETVRRGHMVGNHTIHHLFLCNKTNAAKIVPEIDGNGKLIAEALGEPPYLFRTPFGAHCPTLAATLKDLHIRPIGWDIDPQDWRLKNAPKIEAVVRNAFRHLTGRNILLMHDVQAATIVALPKILADLDAENERRVKAGEPPIKVISYDYLLEDRDSKTPLLDAIARAAIDATTAMIQMATEHPVVAVPTSPSGN